MLRDKPASSWPHEKCKWSYKNQQKLYGTFLFENFYSRDRVKILAQNLSKRYHDHFYIHQVLEHLDASFQ